MRKQCRQGKDFFSTLVGAGDIYKARTYLGSWAEKPARLPTRPGSWLPACSLPRRRRRDYLAEWTRLHILRAQLEPCCQAAEPLIIAHAR